LFFLPRARARIIIEILLYARRGLEKLTTRTTSNDGDDDDNKGTDVQQIFSDKYFQLPLKDGK